MLVGAFTPGEGDWTLQALRDSNIIFWDLRCYGYNSQGPRTVLTRAPDLISGSSVLTELPARSNTSIAKCDPPKKQQKKQKQKETKTNMLASSCASKCASTPKCSEIPCFFQASVYSLRQESKSIPFIFFCLRYSQTCSVHYWESVT